MGAVEIVIILGSIVVVTGVFVAAIYRKKKRPTSCKGGSGGCIGCPYACKAFRTTKSNAESFEACLNKAKKEEIS